MPSAQASRTAHGSPSQSDGSTIKCALAMSGIGSDTSPTRLTRSATPASAAARRTLLAVVAHLASHQAELHTGHTPDEAAHHLDQPGLVLERLHGCDIHDGGRRRPGAERRAHAVGSNAEVDDTAPRIGSPPRTPRHLHRPLAARDDVGGVLLKEPATDCQLRAPAERVLPAVDDRGVEVRHAARDAGRTGKGQNDAGRVVHVRMHDVVAALLEQPIERHRKPRVEAALDHLAARLPDALVQGAVEPGQHHEIRLHAVGREVLGELHRTHLGAAALEASEDMQDPERARPFSSWLDATGSARGTRLARRLLASEVANGQHACTRPARRSSPGGASRRRHSDRSAAPAARATPPRRRGTSC